MKFSKSISFATLLLPLLVSSAGAVPSRESNLIARQGNRQGQNGGGNGQGGQGGQQAAAAAQQQQQGQGQNNQQGNGNNGQNGQNGQAAAAAAQNGQNGQNGNNLMRPMRLMRTTTPPTGTTAANGNNNAAADDDPETSTTLDPTVIAKGFAQDGQDPPVDGQSASLTSTNNFINFCVGQTITDGKQIKGGSCNPCPIGQIPSTQNMPSSKFLFPPNGDTSLEANAQFTLKMNIRGMKTGTFVNANANYFAAPQQLDGSGQIIGHTHVVVEKLAALDSTDALDPNKFEFFKGINTAAQGGVVTADVTDGLAAGDYRVCSINSSSNHQPVIVPIAQHGSLDDCSYFTVGGGGGGNANANAGNANANAGNANANAGNANGNANANAGNANGNANANAGNANANAGANANQNANGQQGQQGQAAQQGQQGQGGQGTQRGAQGRNNRRFSRFSREY